MIKTFIYSLLICALIAVGANAQIGNDGNSIESYAVCLDDWVYCNDFYLVANSIGKNLYEVNGFEYGCGYVDRIMWGTIHIYGGYAYFGLAKTAPIHDLGSFYQADIYIDLWSYWGYGCKMYMALIGGVWTVWGSWGDFSMFFCSYPFINGKEGVEVKGLDEALRR